MGTDIHGVLQSKLSGGWFTEGPIEDDRNYRTFAALANVRNGSGFAGVYTHEPIEVIAEPRGLPDDFNRREAANGLGDYSDGAEFWPGDHSESWLTVGEALHWKGWDQPLSEGGWISRAEYEKWDHESPPANGWSGGISGPDVVKAIDGEPPPEGWNYVRVTWGRPLREACGTFIKYLEYAESKVGPDGRIVFGFDS